VPIAPLLRYLEQIIKPTSALPQFPKTFRPPLAVRKGDAIKEGRMRRKSFLDQWNSLVT
jgi:hypothetical protein